MRTRVKICGITRVEDAQACVAAGADAIGLVFYEPSPRYVTVEQARHIVASLPAFVSAVGLFVDADAAQVHEVMSHVALDYLQFHGEESAEYCAQFHRHYIKAIRMREDTDLAALSREFALAKGLLLDSYVAGKPGGTGQSFNWDWVPKQSERPIILAGGLSPDNVAEAIRRARPFAVDVSGGVEQSKGIKDANRIREFINEVQNVGAIE